MIFEARTNNSYPNHIISTTPTFIMIQRTREPERTLTFPQFQNLEYKIRRVQLSSFRDFELEINVKNKEQLSIPITGNRTRTS